MHFINDDHFSGKREPPYKKMFNRHNTPLKPDPLCQRQS